MMRYPAFFGILACSFLVGCVANNNATTQTCECRLVGKFHVDKQSFCPSRFSQGTKEFYLLALDERIQRGKKESTQNYEEMLARHYDVNWAIKKQLGATSGGLSAILVMVGCEKDSLNQYRLVDLGYSARADAWGQLGVAAHILEKYEESERAFEEAVRLEPDYFITRPVQEQIAKAASARQRLHP